MKRLKLIAIMTAFLLIMQFPITAYADTTTYSPYVKGTYNQQAKVQSYTVVHGLDLSYHNGTVNFESLKKQGVKYVILRVGYRGYSSTGKLCSDINFSTFYKAAKTAGLDIGCYFYSQALTEKEAKAEADYLLDKIKGLDMELPVFFDYEFAGVSDGRLDSAWRKGTINKSKMTANAKAFCETIKAAGYVPGIYASTSFFYDNVDYTALQEDYVIWDAHYTSYSSAKKAYVATTFKGNYELWQYSSTGTVYGVHLEKSDNKNGKKYYPVDCNFMYRELMDAKMTKSPFIISEITKRAYTGKEIKPTFTVTCYDKELTKGDDYYVSYANNVNIGTASVTVTGVNDYAEEKSATVTFKIVPSKVENLTFSSRTGDSLTFKWDKHKDADKYRVQILNGTSYKTVGDTKGTSYTISGLSPLGTYTVRVEAIKTVSGTNYVGKASTAVEMMTAPAKVTGLKNAIKSTNSIKLSWTKQSNITHYNVYLYNTSTGTYNYIKSVKTNSYLLENLKANTQYKYKVKAVKVLDDGTKLYGAKSSALTAYTYTAAPTVTSAKSNAKKKITVKWKKVSGADGYQIMRSTTKKFTSNCASNTVTSGKTVSKTVSTSQSKKTYYVRVRAYKKFGSKKIYSPWSKTFSVKTK